MIAKQGSPSAAHDADVLRLFQKLLEDEEAEEVFREFIVPAQRREMRLPWFLPSRSTLHYPVPLRAIVSLVGNLDGLVSQPHSLLRPATNVGARCRARLTQNRDGR